MKPFPSFLALFTAFGALSPAGFGSGPALSATVAANWVENITRCPDPVAARDAMVYDADFAAGWRNQDSRDVSLLFEAHGGVESCPTFSDLSRLILGVDVGIQRKFGLGPLAPVLRADVSFTKSTYREAWLNGNRLFASVAFSKRWSDSWQTVASAEYMKNDGDYPVYDYSNHGLSIEARYDINEIWRVSAGARRQWGDQVVYAWLGGSGANFPYVFEIWKNSTESYVFGDDWFVYTIDAHADSFWISLSPALGENRSLPLRWEQTSVVGRGESYKVRTLSLSFVQRF